jgi:undecaprenyl-diphosphatase
MLWVPPALLSGALFAADLTGVESGVTMSRDRSLDLSVHGAFGPSFYGFFEVMSTLGGGVIRVAVLALIVVALVVARYWWSAALTVVATGGAAGLETLIKLVVGRPRPHLFPHVVAANGSSFPSGHATNACAFALVTVYLLWHVFQHRGLTAAAAVLLIAFVLLVGLSRIVLGVHYPTDVLGGYALATAWVATIIAFFAPALSAETMRAFLRHYDLVDS